MQKQFKFKPSHKLAAVLLLAHGVTVAALLPLDLPLLAKSGLVFLIAFSLLYQLRRTAWLTASTAVVALALEGDDIILTTKNGALIPSRVLRDSLITPYLTVLNVLPQGGRFARSAIILPDSLDAESFRQLRVWLKWGINSPNKKVA